MNKKPICALRDKESAMLTECPTCHNDVMNKCPEWNRSPWVGCGECDIAFPCYNGQQRCLRLEEK